MKRIFIVITALVASMTFVVASASATSSYTTQTGKSCSYCHTSVPALNAAGEAFAANGYQLPVTPPVVTTDLTAYNAALALVAQTTYTPASWTAYQVVVAAHVVTVANTQAEVSAATTAIKAAQASLVVKEVTPPVVTDLTAYNAALALVAQTAYTPASWTTYQVVVAAHVVTVANTQAEVSAATTAIKAAQASLVKVTGDVVCDRHQKDHKIMHQMKHKIKHERKHKVENERKYNVEHQRSHNCR